MEESVEESVEDDKKHPPIYHADEESPGAQKPPVFSNGVQERRAWIRLH